MALNKAILAASIIIAAVAIFFVYSQFNDFDIKGSTPPLVGGLVNTSVIVREGLDDSAFKVGQVSAAQASDSEMTLPDLFVKVEKSVVQITDSDETDPHDSRLGSGFVYDNNGHIITNNHVVSGGGRLDVTFLDGTVYRATLIGSDPFTDLAVLYVQEAPKEKLVPLRQ